MNTSKHSFTKSTNIPNIGLRKVAGTLQSKRENFVSRSPPWESKGGFILSL